MDVGACSEPSLLLLSVYGTRADPFVSRPFNKNILEGRPAARRLIPAWIGDRGVEPRARRTQRPRIGMWSDEKSGNGYRRSAAASVQQCMYLLAALTEIHDSMRVSADGVVS